MVTLPAALLVGHWWKQGRVTSTDLLRLVPFFVVGLVITVGDLSFYQSMKPLSFGYSLVERSLIAARALWFYAGKLLWPTNLSVIYPYWDIRAADPLAWGYLVAAVALAVALWHFRSQLGREPLAGALFFCGYVVAGVGLRRSQLYGPMLLSPTAFSISLALGSWPSSSAQLLLACVACPALWQKGALGVAAVALVVLGMLTWRQASIYRDDETLNRHIIALNPQARNAYRHLGNALYKQERYEEAVAAYHVAIAQRPNQAIAHFNLGGAFNKLRRYEEAGNPPAPCHRPRPKAQAPPPPFRQCPVWAGAVCGSPRRVPRRRTTSRLPSSPFQPWHGLQQAGNALRKRRPTCAAPSHWIQRPSTAISV